MNNYKDKFEYLANRQKGICKIGEKKYDRKDPVTELHHYRIHNTEVNRGLFPLFIDSVLNLVAVNNRNHLNNPSWGIVKGYNSIDGIERFLERHPKIAKLVNGDTL